MRNLSEHIRPNAKVIKIGGVDLRHSRQLEKLLQTIRHTSMLALPETINMISFWNNCFAAFQKVVV